MRVPRFVSLLVSVAAVMCGLLLSAVMADTASAFEPTWIQNHQETQLWSGPADGAVSFGTVRQWSFFQVVAPQGASKRLYVRNPSTNDYGYIDASAVGPSGPLPADRPDLKTVVRPNWVQNYQETDLWSGMDGQAVSFGKVSQWSFLRVASMQEGARRLLVLNPASNNYAYVDVAAVGPSGGPAGWAPVPVVASSGAAAPAGRATAEAMGSVAAPVPAPAEAALRSLPLLPSGVSPAWVANFVETELWNGPGSEATSLGKLPQFRRFLVMEAGASRVKVWSPEKNSYGYLDTSVLGPTGQSVWMSAKLPKLVRKVNLSGRSVSDTAYIRNLTVNDEETELRRVPNNTSLDIQDMVVAADGSEWYTVGERQYIRVSEVRLPRPVEAVHSGRWIDADLGEPTMVTAYEGGKAVRAMLAIKGVDGAPTPLGTFSIQRRIANETMDSSTIGIPRESPHGYLLKDVLYTQYFTSDGAALHYNYWLGTFGYPGSHGCLGLNLEDAKFLWEWAQVGTPVVVRQTSGTEKAPADAKSP